MAAGHSGSTLLLNWPVVGCALLGAPSFLLAVAWATFAPNACTPHQKKKKKKKKKKNMPVSHHHLPSLHLGSAEHCACLLCG
jgi:hypothetical protein